MADFPAIPANFSALSVNSFIHRTAEVYPNRLAIVHEHITRTWGEEGRRCAGVARGLEKLGVQPGETVSILAPNTPSMFEVHFAVPLIGAVLNTMNYRLDAATIAFTIDHCRCKALLVDVEFQQLAREALTMSKLKPVVIDIFDLAPTNSPRLGVIEFEEMIQQAGPQRLQDFNKFPKNEWDSLAINYTSGTTGNPKGVLYHHRGAFLNSLSGNALAWGGMQMHPVYLWTLPMFHCNGWCFPWTITALAGVNICLRRVEAAQIFGAIEKYKVTHMCGAPIVMGILLQGLEQLKPKLSHQVKMMTAAAPPPPAVLQRMTEAGFDVTHVYGLTETYGPGTVCAVQDDWAHLNPVDRADKLARQGVRYHVLDEVQVVDPDTLVPVPRDGKTMGEILMRGNTVMKGYLHNPAATAEAFPNNTFFRTGDIAVMEPDGYLRIKDRSKDIIISGGENISSIEVEGVLFKHPAVLTAAVVAKNDEKWGEVPCAFVELNPGVKATEAELLKFCRASLAGFKMPKQVIFCELPKTSTGKIRKNVLRDMANGVTKAKL